MKRIFGILSLLIVALVSTQGAYAFTPISNENVTTEETTITESDLTTITSEYTLVYSKIIDGNSEWYVYESLNEENTYFVVVKNPAGGYMPSNDLYFDNYLLVSHTEVQADITSIIKIKALSDGLHTISLHDAFANLSDVGKTNFGFYQFTVEIPILGTFLNNILTVALDVPSILVAGIAIFSNAVLTSALVIFAVGLGLISKGFNLVPRIIESLKTKTK